MKQPAVTTDVPHVRIEGLTVSYEKPLGGGTFMAVSDASLDVERGTFVTIVGPSGCGKSSLLLAIAGLSKTSVK
jgi:ABC-type Fe3+/spermidine/putrescine transport system ATPase subunit